MWKILFLLGKTAFKDVSAIYNLMGSAMQEEYSKILPYIDVKSSLFYVKIELNIGEDNLYYHLLVKRNGKVFPH